MYKIKNVGGNIFESVRIEMSGVGGPQPGDTVLKTGRTTGETCGEVSSVGLFTWRDGGISQEVVVVLGGTAPGWFADMGDSGSLVVRMREGGCEAVGLVTGKSADIPRWVSTTPLVDVMGDVERSLQESIFLARKESLDTFGR